VILAGCVVLYRIVTSPSSVLLPKGERPGALRAG
jgi:hypothetical protein